MLLAEKAGIKLDKDQKFDRMIDLSYKCPSYHFLSCVIGLFPIGIQ